jgi:NDP-sugar pyrophosphorylase family protein
MSRVTKKSLHFPKTAMILAAGRGERLRPITDKIPKPLLPIANVPMIERIILQLRNLGVERFLINLHHLAPQIQSYLQNGHPLGVDIWYSHESHLLGTGGGIAKMLPHVQEPHFICLNGDSLITTDLKTIWKVHREQQSDATMLLKTADNNNQETQLIIEIDKNASKKCPWGNIRELLHYKNLKSKHALAGNFLGVHFFNNDFLSSKISKKPVHCIIRDGYLPWLKNSQGKILGVVADQPLLDTGTLERYLAVNAYFLRQETATTVLVDPSVTLDSSVQIGPNVVIGEGCTIGRGCHIRNSVLLPGTKLRDNSIIENQVLLS